MPWCRLAFWLLLYIRLLLAVRSAVASPLPHFRTPPFYVLVPPVPFVLSIDETNSSPYLSSSRPFPSLLFLLSLHLHAQSFSFCLSFFFLPFDFFASPIILLHWHRWNVAEHERHETEGKKKYSVRCMKPFIDFLTKQEAVTKRTSVFWIPILGS